MTTNHFWMAMALSCWAGCGGPVTTTDEPIADTESSLGDNDGSNPQLFGVDSHPYGLSMKEWAFNWLRWEYSIPAATNPAIVAGVDYDQHQLGPVYFVPTGPNHNDAFTVPRYKALAVMLSGISYDYPCPDPTFKPAPGQSLFDFLATGLTQINDNIRVMQVTLDGRPVVDPFRYRFTSSRLFYFVGDKSLATSFDTCVTGSLQPAVADDLFVLLKPLSRGQHVLVTHIENGEGKVFDRTRTITTE
ncbi:MAG TPA: hypothetical protein VK540_24140 [Polyangiaceae bacterium]|nr:hypothetical protein [Polyangiaceae bacterium]